MPLDLPARNPEEEPAMIPEFERAMVLEELGRTFSGCAQLACIDIDSDFCALISGDMRMCKNDYSDEVDEYNVYVRQATYQDDAGKLQYSYEVWAVSDSSDVQVQGYCISPSGEVNDNTALTDNLLRTLILPYTIFDDVSNRDKIDPKTDTQGVPRGALVLRLCQESHVARNLYLDLRYPRDNAA